MITDLIGRHEVLLSINHKNYNCNLPQYQRNDIFVLTIEHTYSDLKVHALHYANELLVRVRHFQNLLQTRLICRNNAWEKSNDGYSLSIRVHTTKNHISIYFLPQYQRQRKCFFQSASWKRHCVTHWREQRGRDSYLPQQISQSDCEISSNCGKKINFTIG